LYGRECAWNPDSEFKDFVAKTLKISGYELSDFGPGLDKDIENYGL
jgi:hypothetical protein